VSRLTAPVDFVTDDVNGYIIDPADRAALSHRMTQLCDDALVGAMGAEAYRQYWLDPQTEAKHIRDLLPVYQTVLADHRARCRSPSAGPA
jgi:glycosyltransferase involved in cell wall biosynthesis